MRWILVALALLGCDPLPPEKVLSPSSVIPVTREDAETSSRFESEFKLSRWELEFGYRRGAPDEEDAPCCGYDTTQVLLIGAPPNRQQAIMPFMLGTWDLVYWNGDRIWVFNETEVMEAGAGDLEIVYSPDGGKSWYALASLPTPSTDIDAHPASIRSVAFDASGHGRLTLCLEEDDEDIHVSPTLLDRIRARIPRIGPLAAWSGPSVDDKVQARAGYYSYRTDDFGHTWSNPTYSPRHPP